MIKYISAFVYVLLGILLSSIFVFVPAGKISASVTNGTIDNAYKYAWAENAGWLNFGLANGQVAVTDNGLSGYVWSENFGWINLNPGSAGVKNDGNGNLYGSAWGENAGWINFSGVIINSSGEFTGTASGDVVGTINFNSVNCSNCKVATDWRPRNTRGSGGSGLLATSGFGNAPILPAIPSNNENIINQIRNQIVVITGQIAGLFGNQPENQHILYPSIAESVPQKPQPVFQNNWQIFPDFGFFNNAKPTKIKDIAKKFPQIANTFKALGMGQIIDPKRLLNATLVLPTIAEALGYSSPGGISAFQGVALNNLSANAKAVIPVDIIFARTPDQKIDYSISLSVAENGDVRQRIETTVNRVIELVVKPAEDVASIDGYLMPIKTDAQPAVRNNLINLFFASLIGANPAPDTNPQPIIVSKFQYADANRDGIYTSQIETPSISGEYKIVTVLNYRDKSLGLKEIDITALVDPEGYVYLQTSEGQTRIAKVVVSIYWLDSADKWELWPAKDYSQYNPQTTDVTGKYSFLVPPGKYYMTAEKKGYNPYKGDAFIVQAGSPVNYDIEMKKTSFNLWKWFTNIFSDR